MDIGRALIVTGLFILAVGLVLTLGARLPLVGRLPGDVSFGGNGWTVYAPIATSIVLSILLTLGLNAVAWLQRR